MTDTPEPDADPLAELAETDSFNRRAEDYEQRLSAGGLSLDSIPPVPDMDDYIDRYLEDPPSDPFGVDTDEAAGAAMAAWVAAVQANSDSKMQRGMYLVTIASIAATKEMMIELGERMSAEERVELQLDMRQQVFSRLWLKYLWEEPWISLFETEFPGPEITQENVAQAEALREEDAKRFAALSGEMSEAEFEFNRFLVDHGLAPEHGDVVALTLISRALVSRRYRPATDVAAVLNDRLMVQGLITTVAANQEHTAWSDLLDHYFPIPD